MSIMNHEEIEVSCAQEATVGRNMASGAGFRVQGLRSDKERGPATRRILEQLHLPQQELLAAPARQKASQGPESAPFDFFRAVGAFELVCDVMNAGGLDDWDGVGTARARFQKRAKLRE